MDKYDLCCHGCELFKIAKQQAGKEGGEKNVVGVSFLNDESGAVKVSVND